MGSGFIKICSYSPYPVKAWVNGHEWAKRQALAAGIGFTALSNGFASGEDPAALQAICDLFGPGTAVRDLRVQALAGAIAAILFAVTGITNVVRRIEFDLLYPWQVT